MKHGLKLIRVYQVFRLEQSYSMKPYIKLNTKLRTAAKNEFEKDIEFQLSYLLTVWTQNANSIKRLLILQNKSQRILHFFKRNVHISNFFKNFNILKLHNKVSLEIASLFVNILINLCRKVFKMVYLYNSFTYT